MKIKDIINLLENQGDWVNRKKTRDHIIYGEDDLEVDHLIICWVATLDVINQAIAKKCHFIITHENPFYSNSTLLPTKIKDAQKIKEKLLKEHQITIYRCHDLWDLYPNFGVRDMWAKTLKFPFKPIDKNSFLGICTDINMTSDELAHHIVQCIEPLHQYGIQLIGSRNKHIKKLAIGTGACTDVFEMSEHNVDAFLVSDDGINNWVSIQWAMDQEIPVFIINHMTCEAPGMIGMQTYLEGCLKDVKCEYLANDYGIYHINK